VRFCYAESMTSPSFYGPLAQAAEDSGYDAMVVPDSICYPERSDSVYPFNPDGTREFLEDKPFLEPFSLIPALGAVTQRLRFVTFVLKLPVRNPVLVAKQATSTAVLTGNRLVLGVGGVRRLEEQGVTDVIVGFRWPYQVGPDLEPLNEKIAKLRRFADHVIAKADS
jgi:alkanesulfonate monooxygenase SsuD/methylene tetrahydromethanopterin reductase-like flavin-dependent oxidoreductase (luciferase family)